MGGVRPITVRSVWHSLYGVQRGETKSHSAIRIHGRESQCAALAGPLRRATLPCAGKCQLSKISRQTATRAAQGPDQQADDLPVNEWRVIDCSH